MTKLRISPNKLNDSLKRLTNKLSDSSIENYTNLFQSLQEQKLQLEQQQAFKINNLEYDLRTTDWLAAKAKDNKLYAQNLYAALCNNDFQKQDVWPIMTNKVWSCSWRYAGGVVADILEEGDYMDWYCSGIREEELETNIDKDGRMYRAEGDVSDEIREDLEKLGWQVIQSKEE